MNIKIDRILLLNLIVSFVPYVAFCVIFLSGDFFWVLSTFSPEMSEGAINRLIMTKLVVFVWFMINFLCAVFGEWWFSDKKPKTDDKVNLW